ncbi:MAG: YqaA family protein [Candidatus Adiutrix sp.]
MGFDFSVYLGLFGAAFLAATILPAQSELLLSGLLLAAYQPPWALILVASLGNILGATLNWLMGLYSLRLMRFKWFPLKRKSLKIGRRWYRKYGRWSLLLSWVPIIGDPITVVAGVLREPLWSFLLIVTVAKTGRYLFLAAVVLHVF